MDGAEKHAFIIASRLCQRPSGTSWGSCLRSFLGSPRVPCGSKCQDWGFHGHLGKWGPNPGNQQVLLTHRQDTSLIYASLSTATESMGHPEGLVWLFLTLGELDPIVLAL